MISLKNILFLSGALLITACGNNAEVAGEQESGLIEITASQFATDSMQLGGIEAIAFENTVTCNGTIVPQPNGTASVSAPLPGVVKSILCHTGQYVQKNQGIMEIGGNELIDLQRDLAEASAAYRQIRSEYERIRTLHGEKVISDKEFISAETGYKTALARYNGLKMKVEAVGFSVSRIEEGEFYTSYTLKSPITGHVCALKTSVGSYIEPHSGLAEIIDPSMFQLQLSVFASDVANIRKGQTVHFKSVNSPEMQSAILNSVGVAVDNNSRSIECYASITGSSLTMPVANTFVESSIITGTDTVSAIPTDAILKTDAGHYILILSKKENNTYYFLKHEVTPGRQFNHYTELPAPLPKGEVLVKGVYNVVI